MTIAIVEHKSTSEECGPGSTYMQMCTLSAQLSTYMVGARALGHEADEILFDVLRKPALQPLLATPFDARKYTKPTKAEPVPRLYSNQREVDETPQEYFARCVSAIAEAPEKYYQRGTVVRLESEERDAAADAWQTADQIRLSRNSGRWPRNVAACRQFNRMCDYWSICSGTSSVDDRSSFEQSTPHEELDTKHHLPMLTTSSMGAYRACPRKYQFRYELGVRAIDRAAVLRFGTRIHAGLEAWAKGGRNLDAALAAMKLDPYDFDSAKADAMLRGYHARWRDEPFDLIGAELEFSAPLVNPDTGAASKTFVLSGKMDALIRRSAA